MTQEWKAEYGRASSERLAKIYYSGRFIGTISSSYHRGGLRPNDGVTVTVRDSLRTSTKSGRKSWRYVLGGKATLRPAYDESDRFPDAYVAFAKHNYWPIHYFLMALKKEGVDMGQWKMPLRSDYMITESNDPLLHDPTSSADRSFAAWEERAKIRSVGLAMGKHMTDHIDQQIKDVALGIMDRPKMEVGYINQTKATSTGWQSYDAHVASLGDPLMNNSQEKNTKIGVALAEVVVARKGVITPLFEGRIEYRGATGQGVILTEMLRQLPAVFKGIPTSEIVLRSVNDINVARVEEDTFEVDVKLVK